MISGSRWILVTGGAGFIGGHIAERLLEEGNKVRILDNFSTGSRKNVERLDGLARDGYFEVAECDLRDAQSVEDAMLDVTHVVHQAALPSVERSIQAPTTTHEVNTTGTLHVLESARRGDVQRVVFAGSSSVYGDQGELPKRESMRPMPKSPYALSKQMGEAYCSLYSELYGLETVTLRYFNVFGPRQNPDSQYAAVIPLFTRAILRGDRPKVFGDGGQTRDFTFIANVVDANLLALGGGGKAGSIYNVACGDRISLLELLSELQGIIGTKIEPEFHPARKGDVRDSQAGIEKAVEELGFKPRVGFREGLTQTVNWFQSEEGAR
ncbi:MAG: SDR family NAD(P)-dependent oxidoreductase [Candidatus Eisenbacteria bacterium]|uniref:SDR family NAD(P)-dependent oxidoreductase n=1 Tax=Eiseniibacteriota bacterium TaxID=2212470 RepID=A0A956NC09_UNCEI|nr:SDR family NAD(P)-dependent oxidoreductase [Candidatus Eisenbacteria bacterium]MCB9462768.1 SDR family NAD(P)-dependent oxidoreductase [Candidatus Eisenbacteria bacterium]